LPAGYFVSDETEFISLFFSWFALGNFFIAFVRPKSLFRTSADRHRWF
jgi:hypothetical protein